MLTTLSPKEYDLVFEVFRGIAQAEWFYRNGENEKACARLVLAEYGDGALSAEQLRDRCLDAAHQRFSRRQ